MSGGEATLAARPSGLELSVVMPVYNEAGAVGGVVRSWVTELDRLQIRYEFLLYDDGSRDETATVLRQLALTSPPLVVKSHLNMGHGPTIMAGYRDATGEWVFQVDSDDEMSPDSFERLWSRRADFDLLLGCRKDRQSPLARRIISAGSRAVVGAVFGRGIRDVNTPYRLIRRSALTVLLPRIPSRAFAPNVIMAGLAVRERLRIDEIWYPSAEAIRHGLHRRLEAMEDRAAMRGGDGGGCRTRARHVGPRGACGASRWLIPAAC